MEAIEFAGLKPLQPVAVSTPIGSGEAEGCYIPAKAVPDDYYPTDEELAAVAKAIGHPMRVRILRFLAEHNACMTGDVAAELPIAQSTVSEHLKILRHAGLVQGEIEGPRISYCINRSMLAALQRAVSTL